MNTQTGIQTIRFTKRGFPRLAVLALAAAALAALTLALFAGGPAPAQAQNVPTISATAVPKDAGTALTINWEAPAGVSGISRYSVRWKSGSESYLGYAGSWGSNARSHFELDTVRTTTIPKPSVTSQVALTPGTTYSIQLSAHDSNGMVIAQTEFTAIAASITGLTVITQGRDVAVEWDEVACSPGPCVTDYLVQWRLEASSAYSTTTNRQSLRKTDDTECSSAGKMCWSPPARRMSPDVAYAVKVTAYTGQAQHYRELGTSAEASVTIPRSISIRGVSVGYVNDRSLAVNWTDAGGATKYRVYWRKDGQDFADSRRSAELSAETYTISGLEPRTRYWVVVRAYDTNGARIGGSEQTSGWTSKFGHASLEPYGPNMLRAKWGAFPLTFAVPLTSVSGSDQGPIAARAVSNDAGTALTIKWEAPAGVAGIVRYSVSWKSGNESYLGYPSSWGSNARVHFELDTVRTTTIPKPSVTSQVALTPSTIYTIRINAHDSNGNVLAGTEFNATPGISHEKVAYKVSWWRTDGESVDQASSTIFTGTSFVILGLDGGIRYTVRLAPYKPMYTKSERGYEIPGESIEMTARTSQQGGGVTGDSGPPPGPVADSGPQEPDTAPTVSDTSAFKTHYATVGEAFSLVLPAADAGSGNGGPYAYSLLNRSDGTAFSANGLSFAAQTQTLSGTPTAEGTHLLTYRIHDGDGNQDTSDSFVEQTKLKILVLPGGVVVGDDGPQESFNGLPPRNMPPLFDPDLDTTLEVPENSPAGTAVGAPVYAIDSNEEDTLTYSLSGDDAASFAIDGDGQITTIDGVTYDYERRSYLAEPSYSLTVNASDGRGGSTVIDVTVTLTDVDDDPGRNLPPEFHEGTSTTREVAENSPAGTNVGEPPTAFDANKDALTYIGFDGTDGALFDLDPDTGQITTKTGVTYDYEAKPSYQVMVIVMETDTNEGHLTGISVTVNLTDVEDEGVVGNGSETSEANSEQEPAANRAPAFDANLDTSLEVPENSPAGTSVGSPITATDPDAGDTVTYSLSGTDAASFEIGSSTGQITTKTGVTYDYEDKSSYSLTVEASDGNLSDSIAVTVTLTNVNEAPAFAGSSATREVPENSAAGTSVGDPVTATDPDAGTTLTYSLSGTDAASFEIGSSTGQITTKTGVTYDYDAKSSYSLTVEASDGNLSDSIAVTVSLTNVNEAPAFAGSSATREVPENSAAGTSVGDPVTATDPDAGTTLTYSLSGTDAASFEIGSSTGQITTKTGVTYDYDAKSSYSLTVKASDGNLSDSIAVTVSLTNVNEAPAFAGSSATREVPENSAAGTSVGDPVTATDPDAGTTLTYSLSGTDAASFEIGSSTGQITTKTGVTYDYDAKSSYSLTVTASDGNLSDSIAVTVSLTNVTETTNADVGDTGGDGSDEEETATLTPVTACKTDMGTLNASALYAGKWDDAECKAHHQDSRARYFHFTVSEQTTVTITLTSDADAALYVSKDTPKNGWGSVPGPGHDHRKDVRRDNGKLIHDGSNTVTLTLEAGTTYTVEAAGDSGDFTVSIAPQ